ncbi:PRC-barrel domain-containing protein [Rhizobiaceae bacterium]|nr:PRC-barrel domain-containing protein [Rhizobiaceae bacterium]
MQTLSKFLLASVATGALTFAAHSQTATPAAPAADEPAVAVDGATPQSLAVGGGQIVVDPQDPKVTVTQEDPTVTVNQAQPEVTVEQPQPEITVTQQKPTVNVQQQAPIITVEQAQPVVTVRIPEPIVTVRLPQPQVDVNSPEPQVQVAQPQPIVRFVRPEPKILIEEAEPQINVQSAEPQVNVNRAEGAEIEVNQADAQVNVREAGEAEVNVTSAEPQVSVESAEGADVTVEQGEAAVNVERTGDEPEVNMTANAAGAAQSLATAGDDRAYLMTLKRTPFYQRRVADLIGAEVFGAAGEEVGNVEDIALAGNKVVAILSIGGFLGLGDHEVAMPLENLVMDGDNVVVQNMTEEQLEALPEYDYRAVTALPKNRTIEYSMTRR